MGNCLRKLVVLSGVTAKRRKYWLLAASCLVPISLGVSEPALAQCTPPPPNASGTASCAAGPYSNINYNTGSTASGLDLTLLSGVMVNSAVGNGNAVSIFNISQVPNPPTSATNTITATGTVITGNGGGNQAALIVQSSGDAVINATNTSVNLRSKGFGNAPRSTIRWVRVSRCQAGS